MSVAILPMKAEFGWDSATMGLVQSSFFWGYLLTQVGGVGGGRFGKPPTQTQHTLLLLLLQGLMQPGLWPCPQALPGIAALSSHAWVRARGSVPLQASDAGMLS